MPDTVVIIVEHLDECLACPRSDDIAIGQIGRTVSQVPIPPMKIGPGPLGNRGEAHMLVGIETTFGCVSVMAFGLFRRASTRSDPVHPLSGGFGNAEPVALYFAARPIERTNQPVHPQLARTL